MDPTEKKLTNKQKLKNDIQLILIFIASWVATLVLGLALCVFLLWLVSRLIEGPGGSYEATDGVKFVVLYGFAAVASIWLIYINIKARRHLFFKYSRKALIVGIILNGLILIGGIIGLGVQDNALSVDESNGCTSLTQQLEVAKGAVLPIATDLGTGTAFAIDAHGTYITAYHVVDGAERIYANLVSGEKPLTVQETAPEYDIAVLKLNESTPNFLKLTSVYDQSDSVYTYGYPGNAFTAGGPTLSSGLISRVLTHEDLKLTDEKIPNELEMVQTDAAVNPGNSGGPLINKCGVVGVISAMSDSNQLGSYGFVSEQGISYAISSNTVANRFGLEIVK